MSRAVRVVSTFALTVLLIPATSLRAQQWSVDAQAGRIRSALDPNAPQTESFVAGVRYDDLLTGFRVMAGIPRSGDEPLWGAVAGAKRLIAERSGFFAGVDVAGNAFLMHDRAQRTRQIPGRGIFDPPTTEILPSMSGNALATQGMPIIGYENASVQAYARAGLSWYKSSFGEQDRTRTVRLAEAGATISPTATLAFVPTVRHYRADEGNYTHAGASAIASFGVTSVWASAGQLISDSSNATSWGAGLSLRVQERTTLNVSVREDALDPLYLTPPQHAWSAGVSVRLGASPVRAAPVPSRYENGQATIRLAVSHASTQPRIAGDFNGWKPAPMQRDGDYWTFTVALKPGVYNYSFVDAQGKWFVPEKHAGRKDDGMGGYVAVLVVQR